MTEFFEVISQSGAHIYHSALQLVPKSSAVWKLYGQLACTLVAKVVTGVPASWDLCTASPGAIKSEKGAAWSPCGQFIATLSYDCVQIHDSNTLEKVAALELPRSSQDSRSLAFSPDGSLLAATRR